MDVELRVTWLSWAEYGEDIQEIRRRVFVTEQGFGPDMVHDPRDRDGLHLGVLSGGRLIAVVSAYLYPDDAPELSAMGLARVGGVTVQGAKRVELPGFRGRGITAWLVSAMSRQFHEVLRPARIILLLRGRHRVLERVYRGFSFRRHGEVELLGERMLVMKVEGAEDLRAFHLEHRRIDKGAAEQGLTAPSLVRFLADHGRLDLVATEALVAENIYTQPLSLAEEIPRLAEQGRLVLAEQLPRIAAAPFPAAPASLLDVGSGAGGYLASLRGLPRFAGYAVRGIEPSAELLCQARASHPALDLGQAGAYATGEESSSHDVITVNFVFIHLRNPDAALLEMYRVLRPGGILYVVDVNDETFRGPVEVLRLIRTHDSCYEGDRTIMSDLPGRAEQLGFEQLCRFATTVRNTGGPEPEFHPDEIRIGWQQGWGLLSFLGARKEIADEFVDVRNRFFRPDCELSVEIQTQVYRKPA
ncbi:class I SAM-dependent methyltransferase [Actinoplanes oblitus]|uniref:Class I SAM-dependent methyltransferase n=1 Tax=Actinoplanes oblitus TaxID=3040509 RepID=A0ABY8W950_9ACTN|nr:class I SAM-dependent methyltransferase [Actinoplanes oblitus]WIM93440.1 class I SAM-dependent methyltransferase [Actinoplanes oblitus]